MVPHDTYGVDLSDCSFATSSIPPLLATAMKLLRLPTSKPTTDISDTVLFSAAKQGTEL